MTDGPFLPPPPPPDGSRGPERGRSGLRALGTVVATILVLGGLAMVGFMVFIAIAMSSYGSNK